MGGEWNEYRLEDLASKIGDGLHGTPRYCDRGQYYFINGNNLVNGRVAYHINTKRVDAEEYQKYKKELSDRTILVSINGTLGNVALYENESVVLGKSACYINLKPGVDRNFVRYALAGGDFQNYIEQYATGTTIKNFSLQSMRNYLIRLPSPKDQKSISNILKTLDDKIELNRQTNETLEAMAQALFKSWFVDFDPVIDNALAARNEIPEPLKARAAARQALGDARKPLPEETRREFPDGFEFVDEMGWVPRGWGVGPLGDYVTVKRGGSPRPIHDFLAEEGLPWVKISDATSSSSRFLSTTKQFIKPEGLRKTTLLNADTLILSNSATPGLPKFLKLDACIHDGWLHFPEVRHFDDFYLYQLFLMVKEQLLMQGNGSVFLNLKTEILRSHVIVIPSLESVGFMSNYLTGLHVKLDKIECETNSLIGIRDTLLPKLLSGQLTIPDAEKLVSNAL